MGFEAKLRMCRDRLLLEVVKGVGRSLFNVLIYGLEEMVPSIILMRRPA